MKDTLHIVLIIILSSALAFITSFLLDIHWVQGHWSRVFLVLGLMFLNLLIGGLMLWEKAKQMKK